MHFLWSAFETKDVASGVTALGVAYYYENMFQLCSRKTLL